MPVRRLTFLFLALAACPAFAHPGHGEPGLLHAHSWTQLMEWLANGALIVFLVLAAAATCWAVKSKLGRRAR